MTTRPKRPRERQINAKGEVEAVTAVVMDTDLGPASNDQGNAGHDQARVASRRLQAIRDKLAGFSYDEIAERYGYNDRSAARQVIIRALQAAELEAVAELRELENGRADLILMSLTPIMTDTKQPNRDRIQAASVLLRTHEHRARLNGTNAPVKLEGVDPGGSDAYRQIMAIYLSDEGLANRVDQWRAEHPEEAGDARPELES